MCLQITGQQSWTLVLNRNKAILTSIIQLKVISIHLIPSPCHERSLGLSPPSLQQILVKLHLCFGF